MTKQEFELEVDGAVYSVTRKTFPFREGVELEVEINAEKIRVSDRQLGEQEAVRILSDLIREKRKI
jgi:hypothetical protein